jgi:hypothetical protein
MKLELKHLAPYLPYGVSVKWFRRDDSTFQTSVLTISDYPFLTKQLFKPILRPLNSISDLGLYMDMYEDDHHNNDDYLFELVDHGGNISLADVNNLPYYVHSWLCKHHFDVFGLINQGLAIDETTISNPSTKEVNN